MIDRELDLPVTRQCQLLDLHRSTVYYQRKPVSDTDLKLMRRIDEMHMQRPFYGSRRVIIPFITDTKSRGYAAVSIRFGGKPPLALLGRS
jgi:hypothetical protein